VPVAASSRKYAIRPLQICYLDSELHVIYSLCCPARRGLTQLAVASAPAGKGLAEEQALSGRPACKSPLARPRVLLPDLPHRRTQRSKTLSGQVSCILDPAGCLAGAETLCDLILANDDFWPSNCTATSDPASHGAFVPVSTERCRNVVS
jgi:hypothetical protein